MCGFKKQQMILPLTVSPSLPPHPLYVDKYTQRVSHSNSRHLCPPLQLEVFFPPPPIPCSYLTYNTLDSMKKATSKIICIFLLYRMRTHVPVDCCLAFRIVYFSIRVPSLKNWPCLILIFCLFWLVYEHAEDRGSCLTNFCSLQVSH